jgi:hypothetical protein
MYRFIVGSSRVILGLWVGSLVHLLISIFSLFGRFPSKESDVAVEAAPVLFYISERYHLLLGSLAVLVAFAGWVGARSRVRLALLILCLTALLTAAGSTIWVSARIDQLREAGQRQTPEFARLHRISNVTYLAQTLLVMSAWAVSLSARTATGDLRPSPDRSLM